MTATRTIAVLAAPRVDAGVAEFLRLGVGLVAGGGTLELVEVGPGRGVLSAAEDLPADVARNLAGLADFDVVPRPVSAEALCELLRASSRVLRIASPTRPGVPELLVIDDAFFESGDARALAAAVVSAGQVLRA